MRGNFNSPQLLQTYRIFGPFCEFIFWQKNVFLRFFQPPFLHCWWKKSCTIWHVWKPVDNEIFTYIYHINWFSLPDFWTNNRISPFQINPPFPKRYIPSLAYKTPSWPAEFPELICGMTLVGNNWSLGRFVAWGLHRFQPGYVFFSNKNSWSFSCGKMWKITQIVSRGNTSAQYLFKWWVFQLAMLLFWDPSCICQLQKACQLLLSRGHFEIWYEDSRVPKWNGAPIIRKKLPRHTKQSKIAAWSMECE